MTQLTEQLDFLGMPVLGKPDVVLVEVSPTRKPKQGTVGAASPAPNLKTADKFEAMANLMQVQIDAKLSHDRQTNTPKRMGQAMSARVDGERMQRTQAALRGLARHHRAGTMPDELAAIRLTSKKAVHELLGAELERVSNGFHDYMIDTGRPRDESIEAHLLWQFSDPKSSEDAKADKIAQMMRDLQFKKYPGYFATPPAVIDLMLDHADIGPVDVVLEPSAGDGAILDAIREREGDTPQLVACEINHSLVDILEAKGYEVIHGDFMQTCVSTQEFDRVLMNPPFERLADIDHVEHAFERLKSGGRLVSVMSLGAFFQSTKKAKAFQAFCDEAGAEVVDLPEGSFKAAGTGVASKLVIIDKE